MAHENCVISPCFMSLVDVVLAVETNEYIFSKVSNILTIDAKL